MRIATQDRARVLDLAGANHLSPALRDGAPVLLPEGQTAGRTGWETFFTALDGAALEVSWDTDDPGSARPIPLAEARPLERHPSLADGLARTRRFLAAWRGAAPKPAADGAG